MAERLLNNSIIAVIPAKAGIQIPHEYWILHSASLHSE